MTESVGTTTVPLSPLMQTWLDDVSGLLSRVNELGVELEQKEGYLDPAVVAETYFSPEAVAALNRTIEGLRAELAAKDNDLAQQRSAEQLLRGSISALQLEAEETEAARVEAVEQLQQANALRAEAERKLSETVADCEAKLALKDQEVAQRDRESAAAVQEAKDVMRKLRLDLAKERVEGRRIAEETLRKEHILDIAKNHQIGKDKGIAIATAYIDAAKEEGADLARSSQLASSIVIQSAQRIEAGFDIHEAELVAEGGGNGGLPGTRKEIRLRGPEDNEIEENSSNNFLGFSRKMR